MAKILIVDDEYMTIEMLTTFLGLIGHQAVGALSGRQTWDKLAYEEPDLILLDIMLPDDNGLNICRKLRLNAATEKTPIIMISAHLLRAGVKCSDGKTAKNNVCATFPADGC